MFQTFNSCNLYNIWRSAIAAFETFDRQAFDKKCKKILTLLQLSSPRCTSLARSCTATSLIHFILIPPQDASMRSSKHYTIDILHTTQSNLTSFKDFNIIGSTAIQSRYYFMDSSENLHHF